ncbi:hypothetical protein GCM10011609_68980 [Lentzea pudingi]|uniref:Uncharacterized protein n=1 Tax=Lentzea pudingi TaxID=1789439 RepID=A0ABQ2IRJ6_9PSEU|nr:hypothetical protein GCM10011609_68980 [Lentzea pudingi]
MCPVSVATCSPSVTRHNVIRLSFAAAATVVPSLVAATAPTAPRPVTSVRLFYTTEWQFQ